MDPLHPTTPIIIFFVGLTVWTPQIPDDCGVKAILPRVTYVHPNTNRTTLLAKGRLATRADTSSQRIENPFGDVPHVEDHLAALIFPTASLDAGSTWGPVHPVLDASGNATPYSYVDLDGDHVRFLTDESTPPADVSALPLPHLRGEVCPLRMAALSSDYLPPYRGAAAVFDLPRGTVTSCMSTTSQGQMRLDTRVTMTSAGSTFIVSASTMKTTRELRLKPASGRVVELLVANLPLGYVKGHTDPPASNAIDGLPHSLAYIAMGASTNGSCPMTLQQWYEQHADKLAVEQCSMPLFSEDGKLQKKPAQSGPPPILKGTLGINAATFECSNSQWP